MHHRRTPRGRGAALAVSVLLGALAAAPPAALADKPELVGRDTTRPSHAHQAHATPGTAPVPGSVSYKDPLAKIAAPSAPADEGTIVLPTGPVEPGSAASVAFVGMNRAVGGTFPPDTQVAASATRVVQGVNAAYRMFDTAGATLQTMSMNQFFGLPSGTFTYDPKVVYDRTGPRPRMYILALQRTGTNDATGISRIWLGVSRTANPTSLNAGQWCRYGINSKFLPGTANSSWADFAGLGTSADTIAISANQFRWPDAGQTFTFNVVRVFNKLAVTNNAATCPSITNVAFRSSATANDGNAFTVQPVQQFTTPSSFAGTTNPVYFVSTEAVPSASYRIWRIANVASGSPKYEFTRVTGNFTFNTPPDAPQPGTTTPLATGFVQVLEAAGRGNQLSAAHVTSCNFTAGTVNESCNRVVRVNVGQTAGGAMTAALNQQATFGGGDNLYYYYPGVAVNNVGQTGVPFQVSGPARFQSVWYSIKNAASATFPTVNALGNGGCTNLADFQGAPWNAVRAGDYTGAETDPDDLLSFWFSGEFSTNVGGVCDWGTAVGGITP